MKKKYFVMAVAAMFTLATVSSCGGKQKSDKDLDDEDTEEMADDEEEDEEECPEGTGSENYYTQDHATFDLHGNVATVSYVYDDRHVVPTYISFNSKGLATLLKVNSSGKPDMGEWSRNDDGRIEQLWWQSEDPWQTRLFYPDNGPDLRVPNSVMNTNQMGNYTLETYSTGKDGHITMKHEEAVHGQELEPTTYDVTLSGVDEHGNWTCYVEKGEYTTAYRRVITYYPDEDYEQLQKADEEQVKKFIKQMYDNNRFQDYEFLEAHGTDCLLSYLRDNYEYDGEGYAVWLFRTASQDGKPGSDNRNGVVRVWLADDGWYHYEFYDGGWHGENRVKAFVYGANVWIDQVEAVSSDVE